MSDSGLLKFDDMSEDALAALARRLAPRLRAGDFLALRGDLGAGKTAFARTLIRALMEHDGEEVPSPTFALVQPYECPRLAIHHFDFYRLSGPDEVAELGLGEALAAGIVIAEWPERLGDGLPPDRLEIALGETADPALRQVELEGFGAFAPRVERFIAVSRFAAEAGWGSARPSFVNGDASPRSYTRLAANGKTAILMDWPRAPDGPPIRGSRPYSRIAHLAEDVTAFVAVAEALRAAGLPAPEIYAKDFAQGFLLMQDFGDEVFTRIAARGEDVAAHYRAAVDALLVLRQHPPASVLAVNGLTHSLPDYDREALAIETELLVDWFLPAVRGEAVPPGAREEFARAWDEQFDWLLTQAPGWVLRDYHSPNLMWRAGGEGLNRLGLLDFQDAVRGHPAYDLVSLLQDARLDLPARIEAELLPYYCDAAARADAAFDRAAFLRAYRLLGAQRNTKILGIFARLARRDGKRGYLRHMPRIARYLTANLADPALARLKAWYDRELPGDIEGLTARV